MNTQHTYLRLKKEPKSLIGESLFVTLFSFSMTLLFVFMTFQGGR